MKAVKYIVLALLLASVLVAGCIGNSPTPTPAAPTATPTPAPTLTATPSPSMLPLSPPFMPGETTNGRDYPDTPVPAIDNGSHPGQMIGELH